MVAPARDGLSASSRQLAGNLVHELRNCLQIISMVPALMALGEPAATATSLSMLARAEQALRDLVDELLLLAKNQVPKYELVPSRVEAVVAEALAKVRGVSILAHHRLEVDTAPDLPAVELARAPCERVLVTLLTTAAEATEAGGTLGLRLRRHPVGVACEVWDRGHGLRPEQVAQLFEPALGLKAVGGVGLGLAFCRAIMEAHGGSLNAHSLPGLGTRYTAVFPAPPPRQERG